MSNRIELPGNIVSIRAIEDSIRSTRKYTEGIETMRKAHPVEGAPIQGDSFPSRSFCKYYEVYPDTEISWDMPAGKAIDLLWRDVPTIDVLFKYDYRVNKASLVIKDDVAVKLLISGIPGFGAALSLAGYPSNNGSSAALAQRTPAEPVKQRV